MPSQADQCRKKAEECRERAAQALTPEMREEFFELADLWDQVANDLTKRRRPKKRQ